MTVLTVKLHHQIEAIFKWTFVNTKEGVCRIMSTLN